MWHFQESHCGSYSHKKKSEVSIISLFSDHTILLLIIIVLLLPPFLILLYHHHPLPPPPHHHYHTLNQSGEVKISEDSITIILYNFQAEKKKI